MKTELVAMMLLTISCTKEPLRSPQTASNQTQDIVAAKTTTHAIGEYYGGGIVFYVDGSGGHGLIADTVDLAPAVWYNAISYVTTGAAATALFTGKANTKAIVTAQGKPFNKNYKYAAWQCSKSKHNGYTDWYLPSKDELSELYTKRDVVGGFTDNGYWSSSEGDNLYSWYVGFNNGGQLALNKNIHFYVRAIRAF